jgi:hypothetical protein
MGGTNFSTNNFFQSHKRPSETIRDFNRRAHYSIRHALEQTFAHWQVKWAEKHFQRSGFYRYKTYQNNYKKYYKPGAVQKSRSMKILDWKIKHGKDTPDPLVQSGKTKEVVLLGTYKFAGNLSTVKASWPGMPKYFYMYRKNKDRGGASCDKTAMLLEVNDEELRDLEIFFNTALNRELRKLEPIYGKALGGIGAGVL